MVVWRISELLRCASYNLWSYSKEERSTSCSSTVCFIIITDHNKTDRKKQSRSQKLFINLHLDIFLIFLLARVGKAQAMWSSFCRTSPPTAPFLFCSFCLSLALLMESWGTQMQSFVLPVHMITTTSMNSLQEKRIFTCCSLAYLGCFTDFV